MRPNIGLIPFGPVICRISTSAKKISKWKKSAYHLQTFKMCKTYYGLMLDGFLNGANKFQLDFRGCNTDLGSDFCIKLIHQIQVFIMVVRRTQPGPFSVSAPVVLFKHKNPTFAQTTSKNPPIVLISWVVEGNSVELRFKTDSAAV